VKPLPLQQAMSTNTRVDSSSALDQNRVADGDDTSISFNVLDAPQVKPQSQATSWKRSDVGPAREICRSSLATLLSRQWSLT
jgi:hypothetical protein